MYLNPDEAQHFDAARPGSWLQTYQASLVLAHPPLFILVLQGILFLGWTELILRLPSLVGGTAALWLTFAWMRGILGETPALAGLGFMALSPAAISASTEVRQYGSSTFLRLRFSLRDRARDCERALAPVYIAFEMENLLPGTEHELSIRDRYGQ